MGHFRMKLHAVETALVVEHAGDGGRGVLAHHPEAGWQLIDLVTVAHPDVEPALPVRIATVLDVGEQLRMPVGAHFGIAVLVMAGIDHLAAQLGGHGLHAIADAEHRHAQLEHRLGGARRLLFRHRGRTAGEDDPLGGEGTDEFPRHVIGMQFAVDVGLAHAPGDQLSVLGAEIEDQDLVVHVLSEA
jgi:hypothetical protein